MINTSEANGQKSKPDSSVVPFSARGRRGGSPENDLHPDGNWGGIAVINIVRNDYLPEVSLALEESVHSGQLLVNLRAEAAPEVLRDSVCGAVSELAGQFGGLDARLERLEHFRPCKPQPTHRLTTPG